jgi:hypothetical protein
MTKASYEDSERMRSKLIRDLSMSDISVRQKIGDDCLLLDTPQGNVSLFYHTSTSDVDSVLMREKEALNKGAVANIFYKDGENFFVLLEGDPMWQRVSRSLKNLSMFDVKHLLYLREKERNVLENQGPERNLVYYQPSTISSGGRLQEGLVKFNMGIIRKDYSHISEDTKGYEHIMEGHGQEFRRIVRASNQAERLDRRLTFKPIETNSHHVVLSNVNIEQTSFF